MELKTYRKLHISYLKYKNAKYLSNKLARRLNEKLRWDYFCKQIIQPPKELDDIMLDSKTVKVVPLRVRGLAEYKRY